MILQRVVGLERAKEARGYEVLILGNRVSQKWKSEHVVFQRHINTLAPAVIHKKRPSTTEHPIFPAQLIDYCLSLLITQANLLAINTHLYTLNTPPYR